MPTPLMEERGRSQGLVDVLDRVLDKGLVIAGDIRVSLADVVRGVRRGRHVERKGRDDRKAGMNAKAAKRAKDIGSNCVYAEYGFASA